MEHALLEPVLTAAAMREADRLTIEAYGIPGFTLMETAGRAAVEAIERRYGTMKGKSIACLCGKGNNGGDGYVIARVLHARGARVTIYSAGTSEELTPDARRNFDLLTSLEAQAPDRIQLLPADQFGTLPAELYVDALLGTGLTSAPRAPLDTFIEHLNAVDAPVVAVDVPSGLNSDTGATPGRCVRSDLTVTMAALKAGLLLGNGPERAGDIEVAEIGIPRHIIERVMTEQPRCAWRWTSQAVNTCLPQRGPDAHKYSVGLALLVAGSPGLTGAPVLASMAAARVGAGAVVCACQEDVQPILAGKFTEVMTLGLTPSLTGGIDPEEALGLLGPRLKQAHALLIGPGLGRNPDTARFVHTLLERVDMPIVIDADGLNALAARPELMTHGNGRWVLTPHAGEFSRLAGVGVDLSDRVQVAQSFARKWNCVLVLKGLPAVVGCPDGRAYINPTGGPALATAGSGDVLAGTIVGLLAQGLAPEEAAACALFLGGTAADLFTSERSPRGMIATDLIDRLPEALGSTLQ